MTVLLSVSLPVGQCNVHVSKSECLAWKMYVVYRLLYARSPKRNIPFQVLLNLDTAAGHSRWFTSKCGNALSASWYHVSYMQWPANCRCFQGLLLEVHIWAGNCSWRREYLSILEGVRCFLCSKEHCRKVGCSHYWKYEQYMEETGEHVCKLLPEICKRKGDGRN